MGKRISSSPSFHLSKKEEKERRFKKKKTRKTTLLEKRVPDTIRVPTHPRMFPIKLFSLFPGRAIFFRITKDTFLATARPVRLDSTRFRGKGPITCQYRHYWRTERNINVYDPMCAHPNPCPFLYPPAFDPLCFSNSGSQIFTQLLRYFTNPILHSSIPLRSKHAYSFVTRSDISYFHRSSFDLVRIVRLLLVE